MGYPAVETLLATEIKALDNFSAKTVSQKNWGILNTGKGQSYVILRKGDFRNDQHSLGAGLGGTVKYLRTWETICEVWTHLKDYGISSTALENRCDEIIARFDAYRKAEDTTANVVDVSVKRGDEPLEIERGKGRRFLRIQMVIETQEESSVTLAE